MSIEQNKRRKIPADIEAEVMFKSDRLCCIDKKRGDHIHHIDGNPSNYDFANLALLCFDCHDLATLKGSLRKKLSPKAIIKYRDFHYTVIQNEREISLRKLNYAITTLTSEDLITASMTAAILIEVIKIKDEYFDCVKLDRNDIVQKLTKFSSYNNARIAFEVLSFLTEVSYETRGNMPSKISITVYNLIAFFFYPVEISEKEDQLFELGRLCLSTGFTLIYDSTIHARNFETTCYGLLIFKFIYLKAKKLNHEKLTKLVLEQYEEIENHLIRPERNDLSEAQLLVKIFKEDLQKPGLSFPIMTEDLFHKIK
jgi:hypothetical protein